MDAATVDSLDSTQFLRSDAADSMSGQLLINDGNANPLEIQRSSQVGIEFNDTSTGSRYLGVNSGNLRYGSNLDHSTNSLVWTSGNDGSGSGLDADLLDGVQGSSYLRSDANDTFTGTLTVSGSAVIDDITINGSTISDAADLTLDVGGYINLDADSGVITLKDGGTSFGSLYKGSNDLVVYSSISDGDIRFLGNDGGSNVTALTLDMSDAGAATFNGNTTFIQSLQVQSGAGSGNPIRIGAGFGGGGSSTIYKSGADLYLQFNNGQTSTNLYLGGGGTTANLRMQGGFIDNIESAYVQNNIYHQGDTDTKIVFGTNTITLATGGESEITVTTTGVQLGDTGNGYFQPVTGEYGSIQIDGGAHNGWEGYSIGGLAVFMTDSTSHMGLYNDANNQWALYSAFNGETQIHHAGVNKINTTSTGANIQGDLNAVDNVYVAGAVIHEGDTDTKIEFNAANQISFETGGSQRAYINNSDFVVQSALKEDYDALSGTTPTIDVDAGGGFSLTMSGNTTFTFSSCTSGVITGFVLQLTGNGSTVTWPTSVDWAGGTAPDAPANGETDILVFITRDGGTTWYGALAIDAAA